MVKVEPALDAAADPFSVFDDPAAIMAYVFRKFGAEALKLVLEDVPEADQEFLAREAENEVTDSANFASWQTRHQRRLRLTRGPLGRL